MARSLILLLLSGCAVPRYTVSIPAVAVVALAGGDASKVPADAPPLISECVWFDRATDITITFPDGRMVKLSTASDGSTAAKARAIDVEAISEGANATMGVVIP